MANNVTLAKKETHLHIPYRTIETPQPSGSLFQRVLQTLRFHPSNFDTRKATVRWWKLAHTSPPPLESIAEPWQEDQVKRVAGHDARVEGERRTKTNSCSGGTVAFRKAGSTTQWCRRSSCTACTSVHNDRWLEFSGLASQIYADVNKVARYTKLCDICPANILYHHATAIDIIDANIAG